MQGLCGCDINSVSEWSDDQSRSIAQIFIGVPEGGVCDSDLAIFLIVIVGIGGPVELELGLPLEGVCFFDVFIIKFLDDISRVGVEGD